MHIVDRRLNPGGKSLSNRQRFLRRAKALVQRAVRDSTKERDIKGLRGDAERQVAGPRKRADVAVAQAQNVVQTGVLAGTQLAASVTERVAKAV